MRTRSVLKPAPAGPLRARQTRAFTLAEMMVAAGVFILMLLGIIFTWLFCLRWDELVCSKLGASEMTRMSFDQLTGAIRTAKWWHIGAAANNGHTVTFTACTNMMDQVGNAIQVSSVPTNSYNTNYAIYYFDTNSCATNWQMCYWTNGMTNVLILLQNLTNTTGTSLTFCAQQYNGTLAQDWQYKYMIVATMEFAQYQYPMTKVGPGYYYNYYRVQLKAASHCPN
jgi:type II secretory pathway pseudopilin PulG